MGTRELKARDCGRCKAGTCYAGSEFCRSCLETIDRIIERAMDGGEMTIEELSTEVGLSVNTIEQRRRRNKKRAQQG